MSASATREKLLTRKEACERMGGCSISTLERRIKNGEVDAQVDSSSMLGRVYITESSVERFLAKRMVPWRPGRTKQTALDAPLTDLDLLDAQ